MSYSSEADLRSPISGGEGGEVDRPINSEDGTPLPERLRLELGTPFFVLYILTSMKLAYDVNLTLEISLPSL